MSNMLKYTRKFIIFKKDYGNMTDLKSKGHGKLELKGNHLNFSVNIQGAEEGNFYSIELIKGREAKSIGKIYTKEDKSGKAELNVNYRELEKEGFLLEKVDGIILRRENHVLLGESLNDNSKVIKRYIEEVATREIQYEDNSLDNESEPQEDIEVEEEFGPEEWISEETQFQEEIEQDEVLPEEQFEIEEDFQVEELTIEPKEDNMEPEEDFTTEEIPIEYIEEIGFISEEIEQIDEIGFTSEEIERIEESIEVEDIDIEDIEDTLESDIEFEVEGSYNDMNPEEMFREKKYEEIMEEIFNIPELGYENNSILNEAEDGVDSKGSRESDETTDYILNILNLFPYSEPFTVNLQGYNWWQIDIDGPEQHKSFLPYFSYVIGGDNKSYRFEEQVNPKDLLDKYGHYIFGVYNESDKVKFYVYGIPAQFSLGSILNGVIQDLIHGMRV